MRSHPSSRTISSICCNRSLSEVSKFGVNREWFYANRDTWDFIQGYNLEYGSIPPISTIKQKFPTATFIKTDAPYEFIVSEVADQA